GGGNIYRGSILFGHGDLDRDGWNAFGTLSVKRNTILRGDDRDFSNAFQPERGLSPDTRGTPFATVFNRTGAQAAINLIGAGLTDPAGNGTMTAINILNLPGAEGCENAGDDMGPYAYQLWNVPASRYACAWDYPAAAVIQQPLDSIDFVGRATFRIVSVHEADAALSASRVEVSNAFESNQISPCSTVRPSILIR